MSAVHAKRTTRTPAKGRSATKASVIALDKFIQATRDSGYKGTANAIAELVDNALQADAKTVAIDIFQGFDERHPIEVMIRDDGHGMDRATLRQSLRFGGSSRFNDRSGMGRYGMGLPNASLSQARRATVYAWQSKRGDVYMSHLDVDDVADGRMVNVPLPRRCDYPLQEERPGSGTIVHWTRCDRLENKRASTIARKLAPALGRRFRYYIWRGVSISINGEPVQAVDPLCLHADSVVTGASQFAETLEYEVTADPDGRGPTGLVKVTFSELPVLDWYSLSNKEKRIRGISKGAGVSIVRAAREVDYGWFFLGGKRRENYDDWWRCEIQFDPRLDEAFGITHTKQQVRPKAHLLEVLSPDIEHTARILNSRARKAHLAARSPNRFAEAEQVARSCDRALPPLAGAPSARDRRIIRGLTKKAPALRSEPDASQGLDYRIVDEPIHERETTFFTYARQEGRLVLIINPRHPFYRAVYKPLLEADNPHDREIRKQLDLILLAAARVEASETDKGDAAKLAEARQAWSDTLATFLDA